MPEKSSDGLERSSSSCISSFENDFDLRIDFAGWHWLEGRSRLNGDRDLMLDVFKSTGFMYLVMGEKLTRFDWGSDGEGRAGEEWKRELPAEGCRVSSLGIGKDERGGVGGRAGSLLSLWLSTIFRAIN